MRNVVRSLALWLSLAPAGSAVASPPPPIVGSTTPPLAQWVSHEVIPGERLAEIADRYAVSAVSLIRWNKLDPERPSYRAGQRLKVHTQLPAREREKLRYVVRAGDSWAKIAKAHGVAVHDLQKRWNRGGGALRPGQELLVWVEPRPGRADGEPGDAPASEPLPVIATDGRAQSVGRPDRGRLVNGAPLPQNDALYTIRNPKRAYGSSHTIESLQRGVAEFRRSSGFARHLVIGDMSDQDGGRFGPHHSHKTGRDVDIALPLRAGVPDGTRPGTIGVVDWRATWTLVRALVGTGEVRYIFLTRARQMALYKAARQSGESDDELGRVLQYPRRARTAIVRHEPGHTKHMHVRFKCGPAEPLCQEL